MIKLIRSSVFETNSSSTHSLVIQSDYPTKYDLSLVPDENGNIEIELGQFGWEWFKYNDAKSKASYLATYAQTVIDDYLNRTENNFPLWYDIEDLQIAETIENNIKRVIENYTKADIVSFIKGDDTYSYYIDHQSLEKSEHEDQLREIGLDENKLHDFLFNRNNWLLGGNDNDSAPFGFYRLKEEVKYKYKLNFLHNTSADVKNLDIKFDRLPTIYELRDELHHHRIIYILEKDLIDTEYNMTNHYKVDYGSIVQNEPYRKTYTASNLVYSVLVEQTKFINKKSYSEYVKVYFELEEIK